MSTADTYVRARIDTQTKRRAADALESMGLSLSDAIRLLMMRIADERRLPFDVHASHDVALPSPAPQAITVAQVNAVPHHAMTEPEVGMAERFGPVTPMNSLTADIRVNYRARLLAAIAGHKSSSQQRPTTRSTP
jgi:addiction module RelB/DinJ family antitoxin